MNTCYEREGVQSSQGQELGMDLVSGQLSSGALVPTVSASASLVSTLSPCSAAFEAALRLCSLASPFQLQ